MLQVFHESIGLSTKSEIGGSSASYAPYYGQSSVYISDFQPGLTLYHCQWYQQGH